MITNWLYCPSCGWSSRKNVIFDSAAPPDCRRCGTQTRQDWSHGQPPATDLGSPRIYEGLDAECSSTRQAEGVARKRAAEWTESMQAAGVDVKWTVDGQAGDKKGGARDVRRLRGSAFGYAGQKSRQSVGEKRT